MNYVLLSPHFPRNYQSFSLELRNQGIRVLGLGDEAYENLGGKLHDALTEYFKVDSLENYDNLVRALGFFTHKYGKIDRIDSLNEHWLESEARLRTDFNITGIKAGDIRAVKRKSEMKKKFAAAGVRTARGQVCVSMSEAEQLIKTTGYPVVAKPDIGVGALGTFKITNENELAEFFNDPPKAAYIFEEFIEGDIFSYDGLTDKDGKVVFQTCHEYQRGIMETVNKDLDIFYIQLREIPKDIESAGKAIIKEFNLRENFFHFEFFRTPDGGLTALEVNMRPPGGYTTDMFNYANDFNIYREYANVKVHNRFEAEYERPFFVAYAGRKNNISYANTPDEVFQKLAPLIVASGNIDSVFRPALGDSFYMVRSSDYHEVREAIDFVQQRAEEEAEEENG